MRSYQREFGGEKNLTTGNVTSYYYSGNKLVAEREASTLRYFHQDSLSSTSLMTDSSGGSLGTMKFSPFGDLRNSLGNLGTDILFTGQRLDDTGLYYYGARFYDPSIGRFISPDSIVQSPNDPQSLNRYSYVRNNPLRYVDPTGRYWQWSDESMMDMWYDDDAPPVQAYTAEELAAVAERGSFIPGEPKLPIEEKLTVIQQIQNAVYGVIGGEITDIMNTALAQDVPVIDVKKGSWLDQILPPNPAVTIFPFGVFTREPMDLQRKAEEGYHWNEEKNSNSLVGWYVGYIVDYRISSVLYAGDPYHSHDAVQAERRAMKYAAEQTNHQYIPPPSVIKYWWNKLWH